MTHSHVERIEEDGVTRVFLSRVVVYEDRGQQGEAYHDDEGAVASSPRCSSPAPQVPVCLRNASTERPSSAKRASSR